MCYILSARIRRPDTVLTHDVFVCGPAIVLANYFHAHPVLRFFLFIRIICFIAVFVLFVLFFIYMFCLRCSGKRREKCSLGVSS